MAENRDEYLNTTGLIIGNRGLPELSTHVIKSSPSSLQNPAQSRQLFVHALTLFRSIEMKNEFDWEERWKGPKDSAEGGMQDLSELFSFVLFVEKIVFFCFHFRPVSFFAFFV
jgi:hypothetical protein